MQPHFGELLRQHRRAAGLTQEELAERAGLSVRGISDLERGARTRPHQDTVKRLATALGVTAQILRSPFGADEHLHNLPALTTSFVGRMREVADIQAALSRHRLVTLTGPGGCGKTRLAIETGRTLIGALYPLGIWLVDLGPHQDGRAIAEAIAAALPITPEVLVPPYDAIRRYLRGGGAVLVLDNCEHLVDDCAPVVERLLRTCSDLTVLVTSRETLRAEGEVTITVSALTLPRGTIVEEIAAAEAVSLFVDRAQLVRPAFTLTQSNAASVAELTRSLDGIPLAIEIAAAWSRVLSPAQILGRLTERRDLTARGSNVLARHRTLGATVAWSVRLLTPAQRVLLGRLSVFAGSFDLETAEVVCGSGEVPSQAVLDLLSDLVDKSLVAVVDGTTGRFHLLRTIRQHAGELLADRGETMDFGRRHLERFLQLAEAPHPSTGSGLSLWLDRLETEIDEFRRALDWALRHDVETGGRLALAIADLAERRGYVSEALDWLARCSTCTDDVTQMRGNLLVEMGWLHWLQAKVEPARECWTKALGVFRELQHIEGESEALLLLSHAEGAAGEVDLAIRHARQALERYVASGADQGLGRAHVYLGELEAVSEAPFEARRRLGEARTLLDGTGSRRLSSAAAGMLGFIAMMDGDLKGAAAHLEVALHDTIDLQDPWWTGVVLRLVAALAAASDQWEPAILVSAASDEVLENADLAFWPLLNEIIESRLAPAANACNPSRVQDLRSRGRRLGQEEAAAVARTILAGVSAR